MSFKHKLLLGSILVAGASGCARQSGEQTQLDHPPQKSATQPAAERAASELPYPAVSLTAASLRSVSIAAPPGAHLKSRAEDQCVVSGQSYSLKIQSVSQRDAAPVKAALARLKTFKRFTVDERSGFIAEFAEPAGTRYQLVRYVSVGTKELRCETTLGRPPKNAEQAAEAYAVCGSLGSSSS